MRRTVLRASVAVGFASAAAFGGALVYFSRKWIRPLRVTFSPPHRSRMESVRFAADDGVQLAGWLLPGAVEMPAIILCHGYQRCMEETFSLGVALRERGFTVLLFDFRACGRSEGRYTTIGDHEPRDLLGAVRFLQHRTGHPRVGVLGISMGGAIAIQAAARCPAIAAVISDSAFAHLEGAVQQRLSSVAPPLRALYWATMIVAERLCGGRVRAVRPVDVVHQIAPRPLLLIHGTDDEVVPLAHQALLAAAAGGTIETWTLAGHRHASSRFHVPDAYIDRVSDFFRRARISSPQSQRVG